jgi:hypothetical protein
MRVSDSRNRTADIIEYTALKLGRCEYMHITRPVIVIRAAGTQAVVITRCDEHRGWGESCQVFHEILGYIGVCSLIIEEIAGDQNEVRVSIDRQFAGSRERGADVASELLAFFNDQTKRTANPRIEVNIRELDEFHSDFNRENAKERKREI